MKVIITGATGLVGAECIRLALKNPHITKVVALARRPVTLPDDGLSESDKAKFKSVTLENLDRDYSKEAREQLRGADACVW